MIAGEKRRILLSAYACEPGKGSEPEVGWQWAIGLARRGHEVWVLTRANNRVPIERGTAALKLPNLHFVYYDPPDWILRLKRCIGFNIFYRLWQHGALGTARELHERVRFDHCQHATFVVIRHPSLLRHLDVPYTLGPVSGGEHSPSALLRELPLRFRAAELVRRWSNLVLMSTPSVRDTLRKAQRIVVTSAQTESLVPMAWRHKVVRRLAICSEVNPPQAKHAAHEPLRALYVGRLLHWKGLHLGIRAVAEARRAGCHVQLTVVGHGPARRWLMEFAERMGVTEDLVFEPWRDRAGLEATYAEHDVLLFPSLRDSGGMVVLEAMQRGLPAICLDLAGPGQIVDEGSGYVVGGDSPGLVVEEIAKALCALRGSQAVYSRLSLGAVARASDFAPARLLSSLGY